MARRRPPKDERDEVLAELAEIADQLEAQPTLFARRLELFRRGRELQPPILQRELAAAARVSEGAVNKELKRPTKGT